MIQSRSFTHGLSAGRIIVVALAILLVEIISPAPIPAQSDDTSAAQWRRTVDGWERADLWDLTTADEEIAPPSPPWRVVWPHPLVIACLQAAVALALLRFPRPKGLAATP